MHLENWNKKLYGDLKVSAVFKRNFELRRVVASMTQDEAITLPWFQPKIDFSEEKCHRKCLKEHFWAFRFKNFLVGGGEGGVACLQTPPWRLLPLVLKTCLILFFCFVLVVLFTNWIFYTKSIYLFFLSFYPSFSLSSEIICWSIDQSTLLSQSLNAQLVSQSVFESVGRSFCQLFSLSASQAVCLFDSCLVCHLVGR